MSQQNTNMSSYFIQFKQLVQSIRNFFLVTIPSLFEDPNFRVLYSRNQAVGSTTFTIQSREEDTVLKYRVRKERGRLRGA